MHGLIEAPSETRWTPAFLANSCRDKYPTKHDKVAGEWTVQESGVGFRSNRSKYGGCYKEQHAQSAPFASRAKPKHSKDTIEGLQRRELSLEG